MSRIRVLAAIAGGLAFPVILGAQSLDGGDPPAPAFGTPGATTSTFLPGAPEAEGSSLVVPGVVPEPASFVLMATGMLVVLAGVARRPRR